MDYLKNCANRIVREIETVTKHDINLMDEEGVIIASTDSKRIGKIHTGALQIIEQQLDELVVKEDDEAAGVKEGANYPLMMGNTVVGVIGITGDWEETSRLGKLTQKMTQLLLTEMSAKEHKSFLEGLLHQYISEWIRNDNIVVNKAFVNQGKQLGVDITVPRRLLLVSVQMNDMSADAGKETWDRDQIEERIQNYVRRADPFSIFLKTASFLLIGVSNRSDKGMQKLAEGILSVGKKFETTRIGIGIDEKSHSYLKISESFNEANKALRCSFLQQEDWICFFKDINLEIFLDEISAETKTKYLQKLFRGYEQEEMDEALRLVDVLYRNDGSLRGASEALHMHKNTLQYKLRKIHERTGYDPRSCRGVSLFNMAIIFMTDLQDDYSGKQG
ncbi:MAG: helix-turn-helix domain-containing protein [Lachnospiraceae bacterium]|nr:helix-turn-helix domain-containing protein [Lachnospiraceae bacterium]